MSSGEVDLFSADPPHEQLRSEDWQSESLHALSPLLDLLRSIQQSKSRLREGADMYHEEPATRSPERSEEGENLNPHQVPEPASLIFGRLQPQNSCSVESLVHEISNSEDDDGTELPDNPSEEPHQSVEEVVCLLITFFYRKETQRMKQRS